MTRSGEETIDARVRDALVSLIRRDRETNGNPGLEGDRERLREWLAQVLVDSDKLIGHMKFLERRQKEETKPPKRVRTRGPSAAPPRPAVSTRRHQEFLPEE